MKILFIGKNHSQGLKDSDPISLSSVARSQRYSIAKALGELLDIVICVDFEKSALLAVKAARKVSIPFRTGIKAPSDPGIIKLMPNEREFLPQIWPGQFQ